MRLPPRVSPEPYPSIPESLRSQWEDFHLLDEPARERLIASLGAWEATLTAAQRAGFRLEAFAWMMEVYGREVGNEWGLLTGSQVQGTVMCNFLKALCVQLLCEATRRPIDHVVVSVPVGIQFEHVRGMRDVLTEEMWDEGGFLAHVDPKSPESPPPAPWAH